MHNFGSFLFLLCLQLREIFQVIVTVVIEVDICVQVLIHILRLFHESLVLKIVIIIRDFLLLDNVNFFLKLSHAV